MTPEELNRKRPSSKTSRANLLRGAEQARAAEAPLVWTSRGWTNATFPLVPLADLAVQHGFGFFETLRAYGGRVFRHEEHFRRMERSAKAFRVTLPLDAGTFERVATEMLEISRMPDARVRLTVTAGPPPIAAVQVLPLDAPAEEAYTGGVTAWLAPFRRNTRGALSGHKTLNYLENYWAREEAKQRGHFEALMLNERDELSEGTRANLFFAKQGKVLTPALSTGILAGVTRSALLEVCAERGARAEEGVFTAGDLLAADEAFLASTIVEVLPIVGVDGKRIGDGKPGPLARTLRHEFRRKVESELARG
ncbi:MAG: aminotransferase class IV family protein [Planctomycetes bacterium]|nr:aminotransferase class IV family protein [Planctomycetota bacterium]